jgi:hypothetical protein
MLEYYVKEYDRHSSHYPTKEQASVHRLCLCNTELHNFMFLTTYSGGGHAVA